MGIIDRKWIKFVCQTCGTGEVFSLSDKGSGWGGSHWATPDSLKQFHADWEGGGSKEPKPVGIRCNCGSEAIQVESQYGWRCPEEYEAFLSGANSS